jgi:hypothetical protein
MDGIYGVSYDDADRPYVDGGSWIKRFPLPLLCRVPVWPVFINKATPAACCPWSSSSIWLHLNRRPVEPIRGICSCPSTAAASTLGNGAWHLPTLRLLFSRFVSLRRWHLHGALDYGRPARRFTSCCPRLRVEFSNSASGGSLLPAYTAALGLPNTLSTTDRGRQLRRYR